MVKAASKVCAPSPEGAVRALFYSELAPGAQTLPDICILYRKMACEACTGLPFCGALAAAQSSLL